MKRTGGLAALFAILLLSFASLASQLFAHQRIDATLASLCASGSHDGSHERAAHDALSHLQACGYCELVAHAPAPLVTPHGLIGHVVTRGAFVEAFETDAPRIVSRTSAQPRAPPRAA